jgi:hypothetical protein
MILDTVNILTDEVDLEPAHVSQPPKRNNEALRSPSISHGVRQASGKTLMNHRMMFDKGMYTND